MAEDKEQQKGRLINLLDKISHAKTKTKRVVVTDEQRRLFGESSGKRHSSPRKVDRVTGAKRKREDGDCDGYHAKKAKKATPPPSKPRPRPRPVLPSKPQPSTKAMLTSPQATSMPQQITFPRARLERPPRRPRPRDSPRRSVTNKAAHDISEMPPSDSSDESINMDCICGDRGTYKSLGWDVVFCETCKTATHQGCVLGGFEDPPKFLCHHHHSSEHYSRILERAMHRPVSRVGRQLR